VHTISEEVKYKVYFTPRFAFYKVWHIFFIFIFALFRRAKLMIFLDKNKKKFIFATDFINKH